MRTELQTGKTAVGLIGMATIALLASFFSVLTIGALDASTALAKVKTNPSVDISPQIPPLQDREIKLPYFDEQALRPSLAPFDGATEETLVDDATGSSVTGNVFEGSALRVVSGCDGGILHDKGSCDACDKMRDAILTAEYLRPYKVDVERYYDRVMIGSFEVGSNFEGRSATVYHCIDGKLERTNPTINDGRIETFLELGKPFAVIVPEDVQEIEQDDDKSYFLLLAAVICVVAYVLYRKKCRMK